MLAMALFMVFAPWLLHVRVETRHVHAERHLAKAGVANGKVFERSFFGGTARKRGGAKTWRANGLAERGGQSPLGRLGFLIECAFAHRTFQGGRCGKESPAEVEAENAERGRSAEETSSAHTRTYRSRLHTDPVSIAVFMLRCSLLLLNRLGNLRCMGTLV
jgi:hypothetical protein